MFRNWCYLSLYSVLAGLTLARTPLPPRETCAGFKTIDVSRLPRFEIGKFTDAAFNSVLLLDTLPPFFNSSSDNMKQFQKAVEGRPDQLDTYELRGRAPNCKERELIILRRTLDPPGNPCTKTEWINAPAGSPGFTGEVLLFTPDRDIITVALCSERKGSMCTKGFLMVTIRDAMRPLSRKRRLQILRIHEKVGYFREFGIRASDLEDQNPRLNDCEFPQSILTRSKQRRPSYNRPHRGRKNYRY